MYKNVFHQLTTAAQTISIGAVCVLVFLSISTGRLHAQALTDTLASPDTTLSHILPRPASGWFAYLSNGGRIWITEDPSFGQPVLNVSAPSYVPYQGGDLAEPITFHIYSNYARFIDRAEILIFQGHDNSYKNPLVTLRLKKVGLSMKVKWDGQLPAHAGTYQGGSLKYILRVYGGGKMDETYPRYIKLLSPDEIKRRRNSNRATSTRMAGLNSNQTPNANRNGRPASGRSMQTTSADKRFGRAIFGNNNLRIQHIPIIGSTIRVHGQNMPDDVNQVFINGRSVPVNMNNRFLAEYLLPAGMHTFTIRFKQDGKKVVRKLSIKSSANHFFMVGIADVTLSKNTTSGDTGPIKNSHNFGGDLLGQGRLAFYMKAKLKGNYLITAQLDTRQRELEHMFEGFFDKDPQALFRRIDPDRYYTTYGDNSYVRRDVNTMGKFYVRLNWNKSQLLWGNYATNLSGNSLTLYQRGLYGVALDYNSPFSTDWGASHIQLAGFGSNAQTVHGHNEFAATGGSVYYLRHTDILPGSENIIVELRNEVTGLVQRRIILRPDIDYEIDYLQGRIILRRPIPQMAVDKQVGVIRNTPDGNLQYVLLVNYEYRPVGFSADNLTFGGQGKIWLGNHVGIGGTYVNEGRGASKDYRLVGGDLTLRASRNTFVKFEIAKSQRTQSADFSLITAG